MFSNILKVAYCVTAVQMLVLVSCAPEKKDPAPQNSSPELLVYERFDDFAPLLEVQNDTLYVFNFWATWCAPCVEEMPWFEELHEKTAGKKVKVYLVSLDFRKDLDRKLRPFLAERKLQSTVLMLADGRYNEWIDRVSPEWSGAIPATLLLKSGKRAFYGEQFAAYGDLERWVRDFDPEILR
jgi:thiol-disulfide isomerase/thioredoxin